MTVTQHDLLVDPFKTIFAINCRVEDATLHCGALYVDPGNPFRVIRLADSSATLDVCLPEDLVDQPTAVTGWAIQLPIKPRNE